MKKRQFYRFLTIILHNHAQNGEIRNFHRNISTFSELPKFHERANSTADGSAELADPLPLGLKDEFPDFDKIYALLLDLCQELGASRKIRSRTGIKQAVCKDG